MSDRVMSPVAAEKHARRIIRDRYRLARLGKPVDSPAVLADRLLALAEATAKAYPVAPSNVYREHVHYTFSQRFLELCASYPVPVKAGPR